MSQFLGYNDIPVKRGYITGETIVFDATSTFSLNPPAKAKLAEIQVQGADIKYAYNVATVVDGIDVGSGQVLELESDDEISKFRFKSLDGVNTGQIVVHYFNTYIPNA